jgi:hypothetical protein
MSRMSMHSLNNKGYKWETYITGEIFARVVIAVENNVVVIIVHIYPIDNVLNGLVIEGTLDIFSLDVSTSKDVPESMKICTKFCALQNIVFVSYGR